MKFISHRANLQGPSDFENSPASIDRAISLGFDVEIDLRVIAGEFFLGHDSPDYRIDQHFLEERGNHLWIHCKNLGALSAMRKTQLHYFWHQEDDYTLTSHSILWVYPGKEFTHQSVVVMPERNMEIGEILQNIDSFAICSDYVQLLKGGIL